MTCDRSWCKTTTQTKLTSHFFVASRGSPCKSTSMMTTSSTIAHSSTSTVATGVTTSAPSGTKFIPPVFLQHQVCARRVSMCDDVMCARGTRAPSSATSRGSTASTTCSSSTRRRTICDTGVCARTRVFSSVSSHVCARAVS
jgi:hypothetical protein